METENGVNVCRQIINEINKVIVGKEDVVMNVLVSIISGGHILLEDIPGVGKTTLAMAFSKVMDMSYGRLQFTPDVMPSDVVGFSMYNKARDTFEYKPGVIFCNFFLADEINRTSSKTQSALLEVMEEKKVTIDGTTYELESPFTVMATQNPVGSIGTSMLPESQLDRFMMRLTMGYPSREDEISMLKTKEMDKGLLENLKPVVTAKEVVKIQEMVSKVYIHNDIYEYIVDIVSATRNNQKIRLGVSPRGTVSIVNAAKGRAFINGRDYVVPDDVRTIIVPVINHRIVLSNNVGNVTETDIINEIVKSVKVKERR